MNGKGRKKFCGAKNLEFNGSKRERGTPSFSIEWWYIVDKSTG